VRDRSLRIENREKDKNFKKCSCFMCGNPRKFSKDKKTFQEHKADIRYVEDLERLQESKA